MKEENKELKEINFKKDVFIGSSNNATKITEIVKKIAPTTSRVLITGESGTVKDLIAKEPMANVKELYTAPSIVQKSLERMSNDIPREFREQNCDGEQLKYKDMDVKNEMIQHVFPEVEFEQEDCDVCKDTCEFSIIEERLKTEKEMMSIMSRDEMKK